MSARRQKEQAPDIPDHRLCGIIGRGSYGEVWFGKSALGTPRAVKVVRRDWFEKEEHFERELRGIQKFEPVSREHEGLVDILQAGRTGNDLYYVLELADPVEVVLSQDTGDTGGVNRKAPWPDSEDYQPKSLSAELGRRGRFPVDECVSVGKMLAGALAHLHKAGLIHRDVKPSNIIFVGGVPKLADIGLVTAIGEAHSIVGTIGYMPPEGPGSAQSDIFSLGKVVYEMATGKQCQEFPALPSPDLSGASESAGIAELNEIVLKACASDLSRRYQSAEEMAAEFELLERGKSVLKRRRITDQRLLLAKAGGFIAIGGAAFLLARLSFDAVKQTHAPDPGASAANVALESTTIAVLPFESEGGEPTEPEIVGQLSREFARRINGIRGIHAVEAPPFILRGTPEQIRGALHQLNIFTILEGRVRIGDNEVFSLTIVQRRTDDGGELWSEEFEADLANLFSIQEKVALRVAKAQDAPVDGLSRKQRRKPTDNPEAYHEYLLGRYFWNKRSHVGLEKSLEHFEEALALDPQYALAHAGMADAYNVLVGHSFIPTHEGRAKAREAAEKALATDPELAEAHTSLAAVFSDPGEDWSQAEIHYHRALELDPNYLTARQWYAEFLMWQGRFDEAMAQVEIARAMDPTSLIVNVLRGMIHSLAGRHQEAIASLRATLDFDPAFLPGLIQLALTQMRAGDNLGAAETCASILSDSDTKSGTTVRCMAAAARARAGDRGAAQAALDDLLQQEDTPPFPLALVQTSLGQHDEAMKQLRRARRERDWLLVSLRVDSLFDPLRTDPRFQAFMQEAGSE